jgi:hypothetical protein
MNKNFSLEDICGKIINYKNKKNIDIKIWFYRLEDAIYENMKP